MELRLYPPYEHRYTPYALGKKERGSLQDTYDKLSISDLDEGVHF